MKTSRKFCLKRVFDSLSDFDQLLSENADSTFGKKSLRKKQYPNVS